MGDDRLALVLAQVERAGEQRGAVGWGVGGPDSDRVLPLLAGNRRDGGERDVLDGGAAVDVDVDEQVGHAVDQRDRGQTGAASSATAWPVTTVAAVMASADATAS